MRFFRVKATLAAVSALLVLGVSAQGRQQTEQPTPSKPGVQTASVGSGVTPSGQTVSTLAQPGKGIASLGNPITLPELAVDCTALREKTSYMGARIAPKAMPQDSRLVVYAYDANALFPVNALFNRYTHFEFEPGETVVGSYINDETEWEMKVAGTGRDILVRPKVRGASGSMTTITDRRRYEVELFDVSMCANELRYQRVSWSYLDGTYENTKLLSETNAGGRASTRPVGGIPLASGIPLSSESSGIPGKAGRAPNLASATKHASGVQGIPMGGTQTLASGTMQGEDAESPLIRMDKLNAEYSIEGDSEISPSSVMDDGQKTVLKFRSPLSVRPALFAVGADGKAETVEYLAKGSYFMANRVFTHGALLKLGKQEVRVMNRQATKACWWFQSECKQLHVTNMGER